MSTPDFPPLLQAGMHSMTLEQIHAVAVVPFPNNQRRNDLHAKLLTWVGALQALQIGGTLWLDGSFLTEKPGPGDIDCVLWSPYWRNNASDLSDDVKLQASRLLDKNTAESLYELDLYVESPTDQEKFHRESYWRGVLGFARDRTTAKGFVEVLI